MSPIDSLRGASPLAGLSGAGPLAQAARPATGASFPDLVKAALDEASKAQETAGSLQRRFQMEDPDVSLEDTVIAMQKANLGFQAVVQARNKLVSAYTEIMNMNV